MDEHTKPNLKNLFGYLGIIILVIFGLVYVLSTDNMKKTPFDKISSLSGVQNSNYSRVPEMKLDTSKNYFAKIDTDKGIFKIEFFTKDNPITSNNFIFLAKEKFYNGTVFHRVIKGFMIQGGDPKGDGTGGPGYKFPDEKITKNYTRGIVAMANSGPDTNGSQFFIMHQDTNLPKNYVIFGQVIEGMDTIDKIADIPTSDNGYGEKSKPNETVKINRIEIEEK